MECNIFEEMLCEILSLSEHPRGNPLDAGFYHGEMTKKTEIEIYKYTLDEINFYAQQLKNMFDAQKESCNN